MEVALAKKPLEAIDEHFGKVRDPRIDRTKDHKLIDIIAIALCGVICGAEGWVDIEMFGNSKLVWLKTFLELPNGIPSHDTFGRVFSLLDAEQFQAAFYEWVQAVWKITQGQIVNIDGKCLRGSANGRLIWSVPGRERITWFWVSAKSMKSRMRSRPSQNCSKCWRFLAVS